ncbi:protein shisa-4-like [Dreissena polymorpha]|uniref:Uncharacterized protein n=1 Tax=Dreissena polymorpha TaxID=45954 RepID=A0A9D4NF23_DREPO|nr:protein shisa-4-like [Dreissena polymorpha]KAH3893141.1 hypothetical protein DPMN_017285 [Dreissena polymorpha]
MLYAAQYLVGILLAIFGQGTLVEGAETCYYYNSVGQYIRLYCPYSDCCGVYYNRYCCNASPTAVIVGGVLGLLFLIGIVVCIVSCCFCACCPVYQNRVRSRGVYITTAGSNTVAPNYNTISGTTQPSKPPAGAYMAQPPAYQS